MHAQPQPNYHDSSPQAGQKILSTPIRCMLVSMLFACIIIWLNEVHMANAMWHYKCVCMHGMMLSHSFHNRGIRGQSLLVDFLGYKTAWVWDYITVFCFWVTPTFLSGWVNKGNYLYLCIQLQRNVGVTAVGNHRGNSLGEISYAHDIAISVSLKDQYLFTKNVHSLFPGHARHWRQACVRINMYSPIMLLSVLNKSVYILCSWLVMFDQTVV